MAGIAVIIPCYNLGRTVEDAVGSVQCQTRQATEILVIDDGSTDPYTHQVLARLKKSGTCVIRTPNRGVAAARNLGIRLTSSGYIVLLDADDILDETYLEKAAHLLDARSDLDFVSCAIQAFEGASYAWTPPPCTLVDTLTRGGPHISTLLRRTLWESVGGFDESLSAYEDTDFWVSALEKGFRGKTLSEPLLRYRVRSHSRYHQAISRGIYIPTMEKIYKKHWQSIKRNRSELLTAMESFLLDLRTHRQHLEKRRAELERELSEFNDQIAHLVQTLRDRGQEAIDWGDLRRVLPSNVAGDLSHKNSVEGYYIQRFLESHREDIQGHVLVARDSRYTKRSGASRVLHRDVLDVDPANSVATFIADLDEANDIPADTFDCFLLIQMLHGVYDFRAALSHAYRILKPAGVLLCTVPCVRPVSTDEGGPSKDFWRFTEASVRHIFAELFPVDAFEVATYGNVMMYAALLNGLPPNELEPAELDDTDPFFPLICCIRAVKPANPQAWAAEKDRCRPASILTSQGEYDGSGAILVYHRVGALMPDTHGLCVDIDDFRGHMMHLRQHYCPMTLHEFAQAAGAANLPPGAVAVTLDDGYLNCLTTISPILLEFGIPATFFVNTERLGEQHEFWWDTLERVFLSEFPIPSFLDLYADGRWVRHTRTEEERVAVHTALFEAIYSMLPEDRHTAVRRVAAWSGMDLSPRPTHRPMTTDEILQLAVRPGHSIGAHTTHHLSLPLQPLDVQRREIFENKACLERLTGRPTTAFSYPYGEFSRQTMEIVREAGFEIAVTVENRVVRLGAERLLLPRFEIKSCKVDDFVRLLKEICAG